MNELSEPQITAILLILCGAVFLVGGILYTGRAIWKWPIGQTAAYLIWERGSVLLALLINVLGFVLLEDLLDNAGGVVLARMAIVPYILGATILFVAETAYLNDRTWVYSQIIVSVVLAFLAQAAFGAAIVQTGLLASWVGWATIIWNLAWLIVLLIFSRGNVYFPALHHVAPLLIGIALLIRG